MAGLLDMFGSSVDDPRTGAVMQFAQGLLSAPRAMQGLAGGLLNYQQAMAQAKQQAAIEQMRKMQLEQHALQLQQAQQAIKQSELDRGLTQKAFTPVSGIEANRASGIAGPRPEALSVVGQLPQFDPAAFIASGGSADKAFALQQALRKETPKFSTAVQYDQNGRAFVMAENGQIKFLDGVSARDKLVAEDLGGKKVFRSEYSATPIGELGKSYTPDALLQAQTTMRGQNLTDARAREANDINKQASRVQVVTDPERGTLLVDKGTGLMRPAVGLDGQPIKGEAQVAANKRAGQLAEGITMARDLLKQGPTGSYFGAGVDAAARAFGATPKSAEVAARLETLGGWLVSNVPRMEGPQSNVDVENYKTMAARVGDKTLPVAVRLASLDTLEQLQSKYAHLNGAQSRPTAASVPVLRFNPQTGGFD